jgi:hypothetical protein
MTQLTVSGGDQSKLGGSFTEVKQRRSRLVLGWVTIRKRPGAAYMCKSVDVDVIAVTRLILIVSI